MSAEPKQIAGTPDDNDMVRPFGLSFDPDKYGELVVRLTVPDGVARDGLLRFAQAEFSMAQFYNLREAVNDLYDHIRQETP